MRRCAAGVFDELHAYGRRFVRLVGSSSEDAQVNDAIGFPRSVKCDMAFMIRDGVD